MFLVCFEARQNLWHLEFAVQAQNNRGRFEERSRLFPTFFLGRDFVNLSRFPEKLPLVFSAG
jgi:hypothetical protein